MPSNTVFTSHRAFQVASSLIDAGLPFNFEVMINDEFKFTVCHENRPALNKFCLEAKGFEYRKRVIIATGQEFRPLHYNLSSDQYLYECEIGREWVQASATQISYA
jgi:hypothetical protein